MNGPFRVLLVDDDEDDLYLSQRTLAKAGIIGSLTLGDGRDAIDYLSGAGPYSDRERYPLPDVILLDLKMPEVTGFEVLKWMRTQPPLSSVEVYVLTSSDEIRDREQAAKTGAAGYFVKPLSVFQLASIQSRHSTRPSIEKQGS